MSDYVKRKPIPAGGTGIHLDVAGQKKGTVEVRCGGINATGATGYLLWVTTKAWRATVRLSPAAADRLEADLRYLRELDGRPAAPQHPPAQGEQPAAALAVVVAAASQEGQAA